MNPKCQQILNISKEFNLFKSIYQKIFIIIFLSFSTYTGADNIKRKDKNSDGLDITHLPYNSQDHLKCLENNSKDNCQSVNLISSSKLTHAYNFINSQYGRGVVLPESSDRKLIVISPFSDESETLLNINIVDKFGVVTEKSLSEKTKFIIDKNYNLIYIKNGKTIKEKL